MISDKGLGLKALNLIEIGLGRQPDNATPNAIQAGFVLTNQGRAGIQQLLRQDGTRFASNPPLLNGPMRHKLRISLRVAEPAPSEIVVAGLQVTYMISGEWARSGVLCAPAGTQHNSRT